ncbi:sugar phosphate isomerase/epimerase [Sagittula marina]|uniref:Sugar phosphate isomerase/epimerase n=1 Tax=Sagittula marina TaxID=943940 RepID=A0A7W6DLN7_9RHOB|nr:sugar phosphate isomerase/epimerase [Sagittula marina]MBB3984864.1 sugar phosphate isomerase/epimerase [Sagittula marina]
MKLALVTDSLAHLTFEDMLDAASRLGLSAIELNTGGTSNRPHVDVPRLLEDADARKRLLGSVRDKGLKLHAFNAFGNPLHPNDRTQADTLVDSIRLAGLFEVDTVVTASGLPAANPNDTMPNWVTNSWTKENQSALRYQWEEVLFPFWTGIVALARENGVNRIALTLGVNQCVHNVPTLLELRETVGPRIGASLSPASQFLIGADPIQAVEILEHALYNVHATDIMLNPAVQATTSLIDTGNLLDMAHRPWCFTTPGYGHDADWWSRFCYRLAMIQFDGCISATHQDLVLRPMDALHKSTRMLRDVMPLAKRNN